MNKLSNKVATSDDTLRWMWLHTREWFLSKMLRIKRISCHKYTETQFCFKADVSTESVYVLNFTCFHDSDVTHVVIADSFWWAVAFNSIKINSRLRVFVMLSSSSVWCTALSMFNLQSHSYHLLLLSMHAFDISIRQILLRHFINRIIITFVYILTWNHFLACDYGLRKIRSGYRIHCSLCIWATQRILKENMRISFGIIRTERHIQHPHSHNELSTHVHESGKTSLMN